MKDNKMTPPHKPVVTQEDDLSEDEFGTKTSDSEDSYYSELKADFLERTQSRADLEYRIKKKRKISNPLFEYSSEEEKADNDDESEEKQENNEKEEEKVKDKADSTDETSIESVINQCSDEVITVKSTGRVGENYGLGYYKFETIKDNKKYMGIVKKPSGEGYAKHYANFLVHYSKEKWSTSK